MKKPILLSVIALFIIGKINGQTIPVYHPEVDAAVEINAAVTKAKETNKHVLLMIGGNWCRWCRAFEKMVNETSSLDSALKINYVFQHVNFSKENKNTSVMKQYDFPQRFGFPVFVVLNAKGERIHTQNSAYLEAGDGYDVKKVLEFFDNWGASALDAEKYKE